MHRLKYDLFLLFGNTNLTHNSQMKLARLLVWLYLIKYKTNDIPSEYFRAVEFFFGILVCADRQPRNLGLQKVEGMATVFFWLKSSSVLSSVISTMCNVFQNLWEAFIFLPLIFKFVLLLIPDFFF